jgi:thiamine biosynthesis lipoprotein
VLLAACAAALRGCREPASPPSTAAVREPRVYEFPVFNTYATLKLWVVPEVADPVAREAMTSLRELHNRINLFDPESEISRLNRTAADAPFRCSDELWALLGECRRAWEETEGAFDVSVGPLMRLWGIHRKRETLPTDEEIAAALELVGLDRIVFDDDRHTVHFSRPGMYLDFGGIAKGYALQVVLGLLRERNVSPVLVDLGGNIGGTGTPPGRDAFRIGIRNPFDTGDTLGTVQLRDRSIATSGNYERQIVIQGRTIQHIVDPRTGQPVANFAGVTILTPRPVNSDIFSTAVFVRGETLAQKLVERNPGTGIVLVRQGENQPDVQTFGQVQIEP